MAAPFGDRRVQFRREETLENIAVAVRRAAGIENIATFNIVELARWLSKGQSGFGFRSRQFKIEFYDMVEGEKPAYVSFRPLVLHIDREIWELAEVGEHYARYVIAHEIGHLLLHDYAEVAFSNSPDEQTRAFVQEESAEWQANTLASHLVLPVYIAESIGDRRRIIDACQVPAGIAERQLSAGLDQSGPKYLGECCGDCGNFTILPDRTDLKCDTCGARKSILGN